MSRSLELPARGSRHISHEPAITSTANPKVAAAARLASRKGRRDAGAFLVEGPQAVGEGLDRLTELFATPEAVDTHTPMVQAAVDGGVHLRVVTPEVLRVLADTVTPQGLVGVAPVPAPDLDDLLSHATFVVVLDGVSDPGNAGAIIRSADAAGADGVVFLRGAVDPFNPKAVRASTGSLFHLPVLTGIEAEQLNDVSEAGLQLLAADVHASVALGTQDLSRPTALVFGGEAAGISSTVLSRCTVSVHLPIARPRRPGHTGHAESLNLAAAAAVMAYAVHGARSHR
ncbi:TrmH family RNA methyltransferase [Euzebya tangerina]|uniref:TrmH family RNA methyltransferase n=1 Tax=Euzebya tangerina TaxID=591198 RepID=UPI000E31EE28|nr:RNA methyltransferase [Euzebya tangerina]